MRTHLFGFRVFLTTSDADNVSPLFLFYHIEKRNNYNQLNINQLKTSIMQQSKNSNRAMEADTISKHGRNLKNRTRRSNFLMIVCVALLSSFFILSGCDDKNGDKNEFTVTFNSNGGSSVLLQKVEKNKKATKPADLRYPPFVGQKITFVKVCFSPFVWCKFTQVLN